MENVLVQKAASLKQRAISITVSGRLVLALVVLALPTLLTWGLIHFNLQAGLTDYKPTFSVAIFNDETNYWREIATFKAVGFRGGYYIYNDDPAPLPGVHFGAHGPVYPMIYGLLGRVLGWQLYSAPIFNLLVVTLALGAFLAVIRPDRRQLVALGLVIGTFWPLLLFLPSTMQEPLHYGLGALIAAAFTLLIRQGPRASLRLKVVVLALISLATLTRLTWLFLMIPAWLLMLDRWTVRGVIGALLRAGVLMAALLVIWQAFSAPYPISSIARIMDAFRTSPGAGLRAVLHNIQANSSTFNAGSLFAVAQRYQFLGLVAALAGLLIAARRSGTAAQTRREALFHLANLLSILLVIFAMYEFIALRDYRTLSVHLFVSLLLLVALRHYRLVVLIVLSNLLVMPSFFDAFHSYRMQQFHYPAQRLSAFQQAIEPHVVYEPDQSAWCNTVLVDTPLLNTGHLVQIVEFPGGIGTSYLLQSELPRPLPYKYLLMRPGWTGRQSAHAIRLAATELGDLYLNLDAGCSISSIALPRWR